MPDVVQGASEVMELWDRFGGAAFWLASGLVDDAERAGDAVVAAFVELGRSAGEEPGRTSPEHLVAAVRRCCLGAGDPVRAAGAGGSCRTALLGLDDQQLTITALVGSRTLRPVEVAHLLDRPVSDVHAVLRMVLTAVAGRSSPATGPASPARR